MNLLYCIFYYLHRFSPRFLTDVLLNVCWVLFLSGGKRSSWYLSCETMGRFLCLIKSRCFLTFTLRLTNLPYLPEFLRSFLLKFSSFIEVFRKFSYPDDRLGFNWTCFLSYLWSISSSNGDRVLWDFFVSLYLISASRFSNAFLSWLTLYGRAFLRFTRTNSNVYKMDYIVLLLSYNND